MDIRVPEMGGEFTASTQPTRLVVGCALNRGRRPKRERLFSDALRPVDEQRLRETPGRNRSGDPLQQWTLPDGSREPDGLWRRPRCAS